jgi:hypothetical protein
VALQGELKGHGDVVRVFRVLLVEGLIGFDAFYGLLDLFQVSVRLPAVSDDPVDLAAVLIDEEIGRRRVDVESFVDGISDFVAARGAIKNDVVVEEIGVFGIVVELLNQQSAAPSATRVEVDKDELVGFLGLGQGLFERTAQDPRGLGGGERGEEEQAGHGCRFLHRSLLGIRLAVPDNITHPEGKGNPHFPEVPPPFFSGSTRRRSRGRQYPGSLLPTLPRNTR